MDTLNLLLDTIVLRPYVFVFLGIFLIIASLHMGILRTVVFTFLAYTIAFLSEYSSTRNGFPYGYYSYIPTTHDLELWISNVPFMDSLSYSFLCYVAYTMSLLVWSPLTKNGWDVRLSEQDSIKNSFRVIMTTGIFFMLLDVIIDPVAYRGDRWFLGQIYSYKEHGVFFDIPVTNFAGWLLVGTTIIFCFRKVDQWLASPPEIKDFGKRDFPGSALLGPALYLGVLMFNLGVTFYIGEYFLGLCGIVITLGIFYPVQYKLRNPEKLDLGLSPINIRPPEPFGVEDN